MLETLALTPAGGSEATYVAQKNLPDGRVRINEDTTLLSPEMLSIRHSSNRGGAGNPADCVVDRHLVQLSCVKRDSETDVPFTAVVNVTLAIPRHAAFTVGEVSRLINTIADLLYDSSATGTETADLQAILRGQS